MYGEEHLEDGLNLLEPFVLRVLGEWERRIVVVDNAVAPETEICLGHEVHRIGGDNTAREFSGYDRGLWWLRSYYSVAPDAALVIANDTFHRSYGRDYLELFSRQEAEAALNDGSLVGYADSYPRSISLFGLSLRSWIRSSLVLCRVRELEALLPLNAPFRDSEIFSGNGETFFATPSPLSENYRRYLRTWLFGENDPEGECVHMWHSRAPLSAANRDMMQKKARAIMCEHYLSAKAFRLGIPVYDVRRRGAVVPDE
jgi:hypothetical protein